MGGFFQWQLGDGATFEVAVAADQVFQRIGPGAVYAQALPS
jgi:hypothetical protein